MKRFSRSCQSLILSPCRRCRIPDTGDLFSDLFVVTLRDNPSLDVTLTKLYLTWSKQNIIV
jgi:hypothetical protein